MSISVLGFELDVFITYGDGSDSKPTLYVDTAQSIKKPIESIRFGQHLPADAVKLAYASVEPIDADDNIVIVDRSMAVKTNSPEFVNTEERVDGAIFSAYYKNVLITDVFTVSTATQPVKPLYFKHTLDAAVVPSSVAILDSNFQRISPFSYRVIQEPEYTSAGGLTGNYEAVIVYNDLENSFDEDKGELEVYYVQYTDPDTGKVFIILLNNQPVYREATFDDINWTTLRIKTWVKAYTVKSIGNYYEFTLPNDTTYNVRYAENIRMYVVNSLVDNNNMPWFVRITNGTFTHSYLGTVYTYRIPEFRNQSFNPVEPYKLVVDEIATVVGPGMIFIEHAPTELGLWPVDIVIKNNDGTYLYALSSDTSKEGTAHIDSDGTASGLLWVTDRILSYDSRSGLIQLDLVLKDYYQIYVTYYYKEEFYEYTSLNLNPLTNSETLDHYYVIYAVPEQGEGSRDESIFHLKVGRDGLIKECSQADISADVVETPYGRPDLVDSIPNDGDSLGVVGFEVSVNYVWEHSFIRNYTVEGPSDSYGLNHHRYLILAEISVVEQANHMDTVILDDRVRGGGIKEDSIAEAKQINPEVAWYGDIGFGGGIPYPGRAAIIVNLPHGLLSEYDGKFTEDQIRTIVQRHTAFGVYPVLDFYGIIPSISLGENITPNSLIIEWPSEGTDCTYNLYVGTGGSFIKHNSSPIADNPSGNTYTLTDLSADIVYYIYVIATADNPCGHHIKMAEDGLPIGDAVGESAWGDGWTRHAGPKSRVLAAMPLGILVQESIDSLGFEVTVTIV